MSNKNVTLNLQGRLDTSSMEASMKSFQNIVNGLNLTSSIKRQFDDLFSGASKNIKSLQDGIGKGLNNKGEASKLIRDFEAARTSLNKISDKLANLSTKHLDLVPGQKQQLDALTDQLTKLQAVFNKVSLEGLKTQFIGMRNEAKQFAHTIITGSEDATTAVDAQVNALKAERIVLDQTNAALKTKISLQEKNIQTAQGLATSIQDKLGGKAAGRQPLSQADSSALNALGLSAENKKEALAKLDAYIKQATDSMAMFNQTIQDNRLEMGRLTAIYHQLDAAKVKIAELQAEFRNADPATLKQKINEVEAAINNIKSEPMNKVTEAIKKAAETSGKTKTQIEGLGNAVYGATNEFSRMSKAQETAAQIQSRINTMLGLVGSYQLFRRAVKSAVATIKELDSAMTDIAVVTDMTVGDVWDTIDAYNHLASSMGATITGAYNVAKLYYQQGLNQNEVMAVSTETMKMARIAGMEYSDATDYMTAAIRGFNLEMTDAILVNDVFSNLAAKSASDTEEISIALTKTASIAHNAGMEIQTTAALLTQMIETTREASENLGTAMKTIIARFQELKKAPEDMEEVDGEMVDANKIEAALRTVNIALRDSKGQFRDLDDVFLELSKRWDGLDKNTQRYIATVAAGSRQQSRFIAMMSNYERTMELVGYANNSAGASQDQFNKTLDSLEAKLNQLGNAWKTFTTGIMNSDLVKFLVDAATTILNVINGITGALGSIGQPIANLLLFFGALKVGQLILTKLVGSLVGAAAAQTSYTIAMADGTTATIISNTAQKAGIITKITSWVITKLLTLAVKKHTKATFINIIAQKLLDLAAKSTAASMLVSLGIIGLIVAAVIGLIIAIVALVKAAKYNTLEEQFNRAAKATKKFQEELKQAKEELQAITDARAEYEALEQQLAALVDGTESWRAKLKEVNDQVLQLIQQYPKLAQYVQVESGQFKISDEGWEAYIQNQEKQIDFIQQATLISLSREQNMGRDLDAKKIVKSGEGYDKAFSGMGAQTGYEGYETIESQDRRDAASIENVNEIARMFSEDLGFALAAEQAIANDELNLDFVNSILEQQDMAPISNLTNDFDNLGYATRELINAVFENIPALQAHTATVLEATGAENALIQDAINQGVDNKTLNEDNRGILSQAYAGSFEDEIQAYIDAARSGGGRANRVKEKYTQSQITAAAEAAGYTYDKGTDKYTDAEGEEKNLRSLILDDDAFLTALGLDEIENTLSESMTGLSNEFDTVRDSLTDANASMLDIALGNKKAEDLTLDEILKYQTEGSAADISAGVSDDLLMQLYPDAESVEAARQTFEEEINAAFVGLETATDDIFSGVNNTVRNNLTSLGGILTQGLAETLAEKLKASEFTGDSAVLSNAINGFIRGTEEQKAQMLESIAAVDWNDAESIKTLGDTFDQLGIHIPEAELQAFVETMIDVNQAVKKVDFEGLAKNLEKSYKLAKDIKGRADTDRGFSREDYDALIATGKTSTSDFVFDGEQFVYLGNSLDDLRAAVLANTSALLQETIAIAENEIAQAGIVKNLAEQWSWTSGDLEGEQVDLINQIGDYTEQQKRVFLESYANEAAQNGVETDFQAWEIAGMDLAALDEQLSRILGYVERETANQEGLDTYSQQAIQANLMGQDSAQDVLNTTSIGEGEETVAVDPTEQEAALNAMIAQEQGLSLAVDQATKSLQDQGSELSTNSNLIKAHALDVNKANKAQDNLNKTILDNAAALKKTQKGTDQYNAALESVTKEAKKAFGDSVTEEFVENHLEDFEAMADGDEEAFERIGQAVSDDYVQSLIDAGTITESALGDIKTATDALDGMNLEIGGTADFSQIFTQLAAVMGSADAAAATLEALGYEVTFEHDGTYSTQIVGYQQDGSPIKKSVPNYHTVVTRTGAGGTGRKAGGGGGGGGGGDKYEMDVDRYFNPLRRIENIQQKIDNLQSKRENQTGADYIKSLEEEFRLLTEIAKRNKELLDLQKARLAEIQNELLSKYSQYTYLDENGTLQINYDLVMGINNEELGDGLQELLDEWTELTEAVSEYNDTIADIEKQQRDIWQEMLESITDVEDQIREALIERDQAILDSQQERLDAQIEADEKYLESLQQNIDKQRQMREDANREEEQDKLQRRIALLSRDTSGKNATEIAQLQEQLSASQQEEYDTQVDRMIEAQTSAMEQAHEDAQKQIDVLSKIFELKEEEGLYNDEVREILAGGSDSIMSVLEGTQEYQAMSELAKAGARQEWKDAIGKALESGKFYNDIMAGFEALAAALGATINTTPVEDTQPAPSAPAQDTVYTVKKGDTLSEIGQKFGVSWRRLAEYNGIKKANKIRVGQKIKIPAFSTGGLVTDVTPAILHGSQSKPEAVLNPAQTQSFFKFVDWLDGKTADTLMSLGSLFKGTDSIFNDGTNIVYVNVGDVNVKVGEISDRTDATSVGEIIREEILNIARLSGNVSISKQLI